MTQGATAQELGLLQAVQDMFGRPEYLLPLVAAERQYRAHYYRLIAGALLEDLFFDAFTNYANQHLASSVFARAPKGEKGWDYEFNGVRVGHKVYKGGAIAAIWDATLKVSKWTFDHPLQVVVGSHNKKYVHAMDASERLVRMRGVDWTGSRRTPATYGLCVESEGGSVVDLAKTWSVPAGDGPLWETIPFTALWRAAASCVARGALWNHIDLFQLSVASGGPPAGELRVSRDEPRPAAYLLPQAWLADIDVVSNNRALLIPPKTAHGLLMRAQAEGLCAPIGTWYQQYAEDRPPDLYSTQRLEYDSLFSVRGFRR